VRGPHIRRLAVAVAVTTAATGLAGTAVADPSMGKPSVVTATAASGVEAARTAALAHATATGIAQGDELRAQEVMVDPEGARHVRFVRSHRGMPVLGGDLVVHLTRQLAYAGVTRAADHAVEPNGARTLLTARQAEKRAATTAEGDAGRAELVVDARGGASALAYQVRVSGSATAEAGGSRTVVVDALTGRVRSNTPDSDEFLSPQLIDALRERGEQLNPATGTAPHTTGLAATASGTGTSLFAGKVPLSTTKTAARSYLLKDPTRWGTETRDAKGQELENFARGRKFTSTINKWGNGTVAHRASAAVDAQYGITRTLDFSL
jgi:hypothetical protein